jgi:recombinational DNA repair ATPase RecF
LILLIFLVNHDLLNLYKNSEVILLIDDLGAELDTRHLEAVLSEISQSPNQTVLTGIRGEDLDKIVSKFSNFKRINL